MQFRMDLWVSSLSASTPPPSNVSRLFEDYTSHPLLPTLPTFKRAFCHALAMLAWQTASCKPHSLPASGLWKEWLVPKWHSLRGGGAQTGQAPWLVFREDRLGTWPAFTLPSAEWVHLLLEASQSEMHTRGNMKTEHLFMSVVTPEVTTVVNKLGSASYPTSAG